MSIMKPQKAIRGALFAAFFFVLCQVARLMMTVWRDEAYFSCNAWGAFGMPFPPLILVLFALSAFALFFFGLRGAASFSEEWPWLILIAGGASNLFERVSYGCVTDYIFLSYFPAFNLADTMLTIGVFALILQTIVPKRSM